MRTQRMAGTVMFGLLLLALFIGAWLAAPGTPWLVDPMLGP